jgi:hypothetical protein
LIDYQGAARAGTAVEASAAAATSMKANFFIVRSFEFQVAVRLTTLTTSNTPYLKPN